MLGVDSVELRHTLVYVWETLWYRYRTPKTEFHLTGFVSTSAGTRWRRVPVEYASTSEDEYGSNRHASRKGQAQPFPSTRVAQLGGSAPVTPSPGGGGGLRPHPQDDYMKDWTAHSEEIAR